MNRFKTFIVSTKQLIRTVAVAACLALSMASAHAQDVKYAVDGLDYTMPEGQTIQAVGTEQAYYDSNPLLLTGGAHSLWGSITSPEAIVTDKTPLSNVSSDTIFSSNNFNDSAFNSNDVHSKLNVSTQSNKWTAAFLGNVDYDTTRTSEISVYNDLLPTPVRHLGDTFNPQIGYNVLPTDKFNLSATINQGRYFNNSASNVNPNTGTINNTPLSQGSAFTDYNQYALTPSYVHSFDERNSGVFTVNATRYQSLGTNTNVVDTLGPSIGWQTTLTERLTATANVGFQQTSQKTVASAGTGGSDSSIQYNYAGTLNYKGNQDLLASSVSRQEYPFGNGTEALLTTLSLNETHSLNPLFAVGFQGSYQDANYQQTAQGNLQSLYGLGGSFIYHATETLDITATYQYEKETLVGISDSAEKNLGLISLTYHPSPWTF